MRIKFLLSFVLAPFMFLFPATAFAQTQTIDQAINEAIAPVTEKATEIIFWGVDLNGVALPLVVAWLIIGALFFTIYMKFINLRGFRQAIRITAGKYDNPDDPGEVTHFQALSAALSGTVGLGNIAGVAIAISFCHLIDA